MARVKQIVGLDIGSLGIRAVWAQLHGGNFKVTRTEKMSLPVDGKENSELIRSWLTQVGLRNGFASVAISGSQVIFQPGRLAPEDPRTVKQAAEMEAIRFNDMVGDTMLFSADGHEWHEGHRQYLMALIRESSLSKTLESITPEYGVRPADLIPAPVALFTGIMSRLCASGGIDVASPLMVVDIGHSETKIAVGTKKGILFARVFAVGGKQFTEALAKGGALSVQQAESQKIRDGSLNGGEPFSEFLRPVADRWYGQFSAVMAAYRASFTGAPFAIKNVIVSGGGSQLNGFAAWLEQRSGFPVHQASEFSGEFDISVFGTALGLAKTSLEIPGVPYISLLPSALRDEVVFREKKPYWIAAGITGALALGVFTFGLIYSQGRVMAALERERAELEERQNIAKEIEKIQNETEELRKEARSLKKLLKGAPAAREMLSLISNSLSPDDWISLICDEETYMRNDAPAQQKNKQVPLVRPGFFVPGFRDTNLDNSKADEAEKDVALAPGASDFTVFIIEGYTPDMSLKSVKSMITKIKSGSKVKKVDLLSDDLVKPPAPLPPFANRSVMPEMRRFVMRVEVSRP